MKIIKCYAALILLAGCGESKSNTTEPAAAAPSSGEEAPAAGASGNQCEELATVCHSHDEGYPLVAECHTIGHDSDQAACSARYEECMAACKTAAGAHAHPE